MLKTVHMAGGGLWYEIRGLQRGDIEAITPRADFAEEQALGGDPLRRAIPGGLNYTVVRSSFRGMNPRPIACGGFRKRGEGQHILWAYTGVLCRREWGMVARAARHGLEVLRSGGARSVSTIVKADDLAARGFARQLGFTIDGAWEPPADWTGGAYRVMQQTFGEN
jgi:hypothetical protein